MLLNACVERCRVGPCTSDARYECPRCAVKYCSVPCYRQHSNICVSAFAEHADNNLRGIKLSDFDKKEANKQLRAALERLDEDNPLIERTLPEELLDLTIHSESSSNGENEEKSESELSEEKWIGDDNSGEDCEGVDEPNDVADMLEDLIEEMEETNPSFEDIISRLPKDMVEEFHEMIHDGRIGRFLPIWRPWWLQSRVIEEGIVEHSQSNALPPKPEESDLTCPVKVAHRKAGPIMLFNAVDVVYGYCLMMRVHNGDWKADCSATTKFLWEISTVLADDIRHTSIEDAMKICLKRGEQVTGVKGATLEAIADTSAIFAGRKDWLSRALWEVYRLLENASSDCKGQQAREITKRKLKIGFFMSWCLGTDDEIFLNASRKISSILDQEEGTKTQLDIARRAIELVENTGKFGKIQISFP